MSTGSANMASAKLREGKYKKRFVHLSRQESYVLCRKALRNCDHLVKATRREILKYFLKSTEEIAQKVRADYENTFIYLEVYKSGEKHFLRVYLEPDDELEFTDVRLNHGPVVNVPELLQEIDDEEDDPDFEIEDDELSEREVPILQTRIVYT